MSTIALITGANKGIGLEAARRLGETGITILVGARDQAKGEVAASKLREQGAAAHAILIDVSKEDTIVAAAAKVTADFGRLDILINNAGIAPDLNQGVKPRDLDSRMLREVFETNAFGAFLTAKHFLPLLRRSRAGRIINVSSRLGSLGTLSDPADPAYAVNAAAYNASKTALNALTVALAKDLAKDRISVNAVCPGWVKTDLGGPDAQRTVEQGAKVIVELVMSGNPPTGTYTNDTGTIPW